MKEEVRGQHGPIRFKIPRPHSPGGDSTKEKGVDQHDAAGREMSAQGAQLNEEEKSKISDKGTRGEGIWAIVFGCTERTQKFGLRPQGRGQNQTRNSCRGIRAEGGLLENLETGSAKSKGVVQKRQELRVGVRTYSSGRAYCGGAHPRRSDNAE